MDNSLGGISKGTMTSTKAHFVISGEFITKFFRNRLTESGWQHAVSAFLDSMEGIDYDTIIEILKGNKTLVGDNETSLENELPEVKKKWNDHLQWLYAGTVFDQRTNSYWKPYAYVTNWGKRDLIDSHNKYHKYRERSCDKIAWGEARCCHYMDDPQKDRGYNLKYIDQITFVLWKEVVPLPIWMNQRVNEWQNGLDDFCKIHGNSLQERGNQQFYGNAPGMWSPRSSSVKSTPSDSVDFLAGLAERVAENTGLPLEAVKSTASAIAGTQDYTSKPKPTKNYQEQSGYIAPDGEFYSCPFHGHAPLANRLLLHICGVNLSDPKYLDENNLQIDPEKNAEKRGFIRISVGLSGNINIKEIERRITPDQLATLELWCVINNEKMPSWAREFAEKPKD